MSNQPTHVLCPLCRVGMKQVRSKVCRACSAPNWKGGKRISEGYTMLWNKEAQKYVYEHRVVMARCLGRELFPYEIVHHKDGNRSNNNIENLELLPHQGRHNKRVQSVFQENIALKLLLLRLAGVVSNRKGI